MSDRPSAAEMCARSDLIDTLPAELLYAIARGHLPALCALRACCSVYRAALWWHLELEDTLWLCPEEVSLGCCEFISTLPGLRWIVLANGQWGGCGASRQLGKRLLTIDVTALRTARSICVKPAVLNVFAGNESCVWAVHLADDSLRINSEVIGMLCAPLLRQNRQLVKLVTRCGPTARGPSPGMIGPPLCSSVINVALVRSGRCENWSQLVGSATRSLSPERPLDNNAAVLVAGLLAAPLPRELHVDLTGLRAVCGAALAFSEARCGRRFVRASEPPPATTPTSALRPTPSSPVLSPTSLARSRLMAARAAHRIPWGAGPLEAGELPLGLGGECKGGAPPASVVRRLRPLLASLTNAQACGGSLGPPHSGGHSSLLSLPAFVINAWVAMRWQREHGDRWEVPTMAPIASPDSFEAEALTVRDSARSPRREMVSVD